MDEAVELVLLLEEILGRRMSGLPLQRQMHALVASVLLRVSRSDAFNGDAQPQPPHREFRQTKQGVGTGEGDAVVGADGLR